MNDDTSDTTAAETESAGKLLAERAARKTRYAELKCKIEEDDAALDRQRKRINDMFSQYMHGIVDLNYFGASATGTSVDPRAIVERDALHKLIDEMSTTRADYDRAVTAHNKLVEEHDALLKQIAR